MHFYLIIMINLLLLIPLVGTLLILPIGYKFNLLKSKPSSFASLTRSSTTTSASSLGNGGEEDLNLALFQKEKMKKIALATSLLNLFVSIIMWYQFDSNSTDYQFVYEFNQLNFCHFHVGLDGISLYFVLLTTFITPLCILSN